MNLAEWITNYYRISKLKCQFKKITIIYICADKREDMPCFNSITIASNIYHHI